MADKIDNQSSKNVTEVSSSKSKTTEPKFARMKLSESDVSGESENEEKSEKRRKKLEEERRMLKLKRRIMSSDEEIEDEKEVEIMTPSKNVDMNNANGNEKQHNTLGNSGDDQSSWSSDDGKKGKNAFISNLVIGVVTKSSAALASLQT